MPPNETGSELSTAFFSPARYNLTSWVATYYTPLSRGEAIRDKPAQYISMGARVSVRVVPNMEALTTPA